MSATEVNDPVESFQENWKLEMEFGNLDLAILLAYRMMDSWNAKLTVIGDVENERDKPKAEKFLARLVDLARLPADTAAHLADGDFHRYASSAPEADLNIFPLPENLDANSSGIYATPPALPACSHRIVEMKVRWHNGGRFVPTTTASMYLKEIQCQAVASNIGEP